MAGQKQRAAGTRGRATRGRGTRSAAPLRAAAARAVERVLSSPDAFTLMIRRLEAEGWRIERAPLAVPPVVEEEPVATPPAAGADRAARPAAGVRSAR